MYWLQEFIVSNGSNAEFVVSNAEFVVSNIGFFLYREI